MRQCLVDSWSTRARKRAIRRNSHDIQYNELNAPLMLAALGSAAVKKLVTDDGCEA